MRAVPRLREFMRELKRRKVFQVAGLYVVAAWGAALGASELFPAFGIPEWVVRFFVIGAILGFPLALIMAWAFEVSIEGDGIVVDHGKQAEPHAANTTVWDASETLELSWSDTNGEHKRQFRNVCVIGRDPQADLVIDETMISRTHARISYVNPNWMIEDLGSRNGTRVDGAMIDGATPLPGGSQIGLYAGRSTIAVRVISPQTDFDSGGN